MFAGLAKRPLVAFVVLFAGGIASAGCLKINFIFLYCFLCAAFVVTTLLLKNNFHFKWLLLAVIFLCGATSLSNARYVARNHICRYIHPRNHQEYVVQGYILGEPQLGAGRSTFILETEAIHSHRKNYRCSGKVLVNLKSKKYFRYGAELILKGTVFRPLSYGKRRRFSYRNYLYRQGIFFIMRVNSDKDLIMVSSAKGSILRKCILRVKSAMIAKFDAYLPRLPAAILEAMVLGEKRNIPSQIYNSMMKTGTVHILVVSGFNVAIVMLAIILLLKLIRMPRFLRMGIAVICLILYCFLTGASAPVVRATIMAIVFSAAAALRRRTDIYTSLSIAALFILVVNPWQLFDIGFQLSFASVFSIAYFFPRIKSFLPEYFFKVRYIGLVWDACLVSLSAWLGTAGLILYYFGMLSPITVVANIFIVPLAALITLSGCMLLVVSFLCPALAHFCAASCQLCILILLSFNTWLSKIPYACLYFW